MIVYNNLSSLDVIYMYVTLTVMMELFTNLVTPRKEMGEMVEVGTGWSGWSGTQPDGRCACLC